MEFKLGDKVSFTTKYNERVSGEVVGFEGEDTLLVNAFIPSWDMEVRCMVRSYSCNLVN